MVPNGYIQGKCVAAIHLISINEFMLSFLFCMDSKNILSFNILSFLFCMDCKNIYMLFTNYAPPPCGTGFRFHAPYM